MKGTCKFYSSDVAVTATSVNYQPDYQIKLNKTKKQKSLQKIGSIKNTYIYVESSLIWTYINSSQTEYEEDAAFRVEYS